MLNRFVLNRFVLVNPDLMNLGFEVYFTMMVLRSKRSVVK